MKTGHFYFGKNQTFLNWLDILSVFALTSPGGAGRFRLLNEAVIFRRDLRVREILERRKEDEI